ncbi:TetR/AcrR family transcriptional regulator [Roseobacter weihaiensis]|uniref:TetR/AcrR family transcriptional regulator n=1 Tax=Roseobacter weihaiensis TaxID=2763262 RepID=UPI001D0AC21B|nr:TetR/AcrR family transcriptional regulator [Roseobacter sp. H9]
MNATTAPQPSPRKRPRGRPRVLERQTALDQAVDVFWDHGYEGASLELLTEATGVSRPTLYSAFNNKRSLFLAAIDAYEDGIGADALAAFEAEPNIRLAVRAFLDISAHNNTHPDHPAGCLIACCAITSAQTMPDVRAKIEQSFRRTEACVCERFEREVENGKLSSEPTANERAKLLLDLMSAQAVRARAGESRDDLVQGARARAAMVLASMPPDAEGET